MERLEAFFLMTFWGPPRNNIRQAALLLLREEDGVPTIRNTGNQQRIVEHRAQTQQQPHAAAIPVAVIVKLEMMIACDYEIGWPFKRHKTT
jgi:hypothetical protein